MSWYRIAAQQIEDARDLQYDDQLTVLRTVLLDLAGRLDTADARFKATLRTMRSAPAAVSPESDLEQARRQV